MSTYWAILEKIPGSKLRLTKYDDEILEHFNKEFPDFDLKATINEDEMKSKDGKDKWRTFINEYEKPNDPDLLTESHPLLPPGLSEPAHTASFERHHFSVVTKFDESQLLTESARNILPPSPTAYDTRDQIHQNR